MTCEGEGRNFPSMDLQNRPLPPTFVSPARSRALGRWPTAEPWLFHPSPLRLRCFWLRLRHGEVCDWARNVHDWLPRGLGIVPICASVIRSLSPGSWGGENEVASHD